jgi:hypothetical protein
VYNYIHSKLEFSSHFSRNPNLSVNTRSVKERPVAYLNQPKQQQNNRRAYASFEEKQETTQVYHCNWIRLMFKYANKILLLLQIKYCFYYKYNTAFITNKILLLLQIKYCFYYKNHVQNVL